MEAIVLVDAVAGFEKSVIDGFRRMEQVQRVRRLRRGHHRLALVLELEDADEVTRFLSNQARRLVGVRGCAHVQSPTRELRAQLAATGTCDRTVSA